MPEIPHISFYAMGTRSTIVLPGLNDEEADHLFRFIKNEIARIEGMLSRFIQESNLSLINAGAAEKPVVVNREMFRILKAAAHYFEKTNGLFDITLRPVLQYWKDHPDGDQKKALDILADLGMNKVRLDERSKTVSFENDRIELDLGGFGKGYALEKINDLLLRYGLESGFITFGESSILTLGQHPAGEYWKVGIKNYLEPEHVVHTYHMRYGSVSTSSNFFVDDNGNLVNHKHVINPRTGVPVEELVTMSVFSQSAIVAEVFSTALLVMPDKEIDIIVEEYPDIEVLKVTYENDTVEKKLWD